MGTVFRPTQHGAAGAGRRGQEGCCPGTKQHLPPLKRDICEGGRKQRGKKSLALEWHRSILNYESISEGWNSSEATARPPCSLTVGRVSTALVLASARYCRNLALTCLQSALRRPRPSSLLYGAAYLRL